MVPMVWNEQKSGLPRAIPTWGTFLTMARLPLDSAIASIQPPSVLYPKRSFKRRAIRNMPLYLNRRQQSKVIWRYLWQSKAYPLALFFGSPPWLFSLASPSCSLRQSRLPATHLTRQRLCRPQRLRQRPLAWVASGVPRRFLKSFPA